MGSNAILKNGTEQELKQLDKNAKAEVDAAVPEAKESPETTDCLFSAYPAMVLVL